MALALKQIKVYLRLIAIVAVAAVVLLVVVKNRHHEADVWFFGLYQQVNVVWLMFTTAVASVVVWWGVRKVFGVIRDLRELRRLQRDQARLEEQRRLAREVAEREKRVDEKVRRAIGEDG